MLHTGSGGYSHARRWLPENFAAVARELKAQHGAEIILVGREEDDTETVKRLLDFETLDVTGQTTLPQLADIIARADLFIGADSGVMHIAAATGTPVISIFGPSNADAWGPWTIPGRAKVLRSGVECSPCSYVGQGIGAREGCAARTCMKLVSQGQVLQAAAAMLDNRSEAADDRQSAASEPASGATRTSEGPWCAG